MLKATPLFFATLLFGFSVSAAAESELKISYQYGVKIGTSPIIGLKVLKISDSILKKEQLSQLKRLDAGIEYIDFSAINISSSVFVALKAYFPELKQIRVNGDAIHFEKIFPDIQQQLETQKISITFEHFYSIKNGIQEPFDIEWLDQEDNSQNPRKKTSKAFCGCSIS